MRQTISSFANGASAAPPFTFSCKLKTVNNLLSVQNSILFIQILRHLNSRASFFDCVKRRRISTDG